MRKLFYELGEFLMEHPKLMKAFDIFYMLMMSALAAFCLIVQNDKWNGFIGGILLINAFTSLVEILTGYKYQLVKKNY